MVVRMPLPPFAAVTWKFYSQSLLPLYYHPTDSQQQHSFWRRKEQTCSVSLASWGMALWGWTAGQDKKEDLKAGLTTYSMPGLFLHAFPTTMATACACLAPFAYLPAHACLCMTLLVFSRTTPSTSSRFVTFSWCRLFNFVNAIMFVDMKEGHLHSAHVKSKPYMLACVASGLPGMLFPTHRRTQSTICLADKTLQSA